jgi:hypothetical protein
MSQKSPGSLRSPRNRALEIGTESSGFTDNAAGAYENGAPAGQGGGGSYRQDTDHTPDPGPPVDPSPFKLGPQ